MSKTHPTKRERTLLAAYVGQVRDALLLGRWMIVIRYEDVLLDGHETGATMDPVHGRWVADLTIGPRFWVDKPEGQRQTIVHELIHLTHHLVTDAVFRGEYRLQLGNGLHDHLWSQTKLGLEYMVDQVARLLAPTVPLPEWGKAS